MHYCESRLCTFSLLFSSCRMHRKDKDWAKQRQYWKLAPLLDVQLTVMQALLNTVL